MIGYAFRMLSLVSIFSLHGYGSGLLSSATVNPVGPCSSPVTVTGTSSASVVLCSSSALATSSFDIASPTLGALAVTDSVAPTIQATSTASFDFPLYVSGGSGLGFLALNFVSTSTGQNDAMASANTKLVASLNGAMYQSAVLCANIPATGGSFSCAGSQPVGFTFVYGVPFDLSVSLIGSAGAGPAALITPTEISTSGDFDYSIFLSGTTLVPNPNAKLNLVPEPSAGSLAALAMLAALVAGVRRQEAGGRRQESGVRRQEAGDRRQY